MEKILEIKNLTVKVADKLVLDNISFSVLVGQTVLILGPNGSGKSTLASVIMGHPDYEIVKGKIIFLGKNILTLKPEERAALGLFLSFQEPRPIAGLEFIPYLFDAHKALHQAQKKKIPNVFNFKDKLDKELLALDVKDDWSNRQLNYGFSGGEKKKAELLQLALSQPKLAILDEIDSGLDVDALQVAMAAILRYKKPSKTLIIISHLQLIWQTLTPDLVLIFSAGKLVKRGGVELAKQAAGNGFAKFL